MAMQKNTQYIIGGIVILIIAGFFLFRTTPINDNVSPPQDGQSADQPQDKTEDEPGENTSLRIMEGIIKISDDLKKGNLMLVSPDRTTYIFTSRDYSNLLDKEVKLEIEGDLENFTLIDIIAK